MNRLTFSFLLVGCIAISSVAGEARGISLAAGLHYLLEYNRVGVDKRTQPSNTSWDNGTGGAIACKHRLNMGKASKLTLLSTLGYDYRPAAWHEHRLSFLLGVGSSVPVGQSTIDAGVLFGITEPYSRRGLNNWGMFCDLELPLKGKTFLIASTQWRHYSDQSIIEVYGLKDTADAFLISIGIGLDI